MNWEKDEVFLSKWLNGELSKEEQSAFEATEEGQEFIRLIQASTLIQPGVYDVEAELGMLNQKMEAAPKARQRVLWSQPSFLLGVAAAVVLLIASVVIFMDGETAIATGYSEQEIVVLPDGSEVKLNASSEVVYKESQWEEERTIALTGEAFFEVKKGSTFQVETVNGTVQVLGTSFNVRSRGAALGVLCYTGKVEVRSANVTRNLTPGDRIRVQGGELTAFQKVILSDDEPSWTSGIIRLENATFAEVLAELEFVFGFEVSYDGSLDELIYTGSFPIASPESALKLVFEPLGIEYAYDLASKKLTIIGK